MNPTTIFNPKNVSASLPAIIGNRARHMLISVLFSAASCLLVNTASAFEDLNEPQQLIYDTSHLEKTKTGNAIVYEYLYLNSISDESIEDEVILSINKEHENAHRDVSIKFLSDERKLPLPDFSNRRGNPVIIGMLEHLAQTMGRETGGGALYFRNRIRDKLADDDVKIVQTASKSEFSFSPFKNDPYVADRIALTESTITIAFSSDVPGQLLSIEYVSGPSNNPESTRKLEFSGLQPE